MYEFLLFIIFLFFIFLQNLPWLDITRTRAQDTHTNWRHRHTATYHTNNQRTHISGIGPGNCTEYGICAPWRWSNGYTETCRGNPTKLFL